MLPVGSRSRSCPPGFQFIPTLCFTRLKNEAYFHSLVLRYVPSPSSTLSILVTSLAAAPVILSSTACDGSRFATPGWPVLPCDEFSSPPSLPCRTRSRFELP